MSFSESSHSITHTIAYTYEGLLGCNDYINNVVIAKWISSELLDVNWSIKIDQLSAVMLVVVTLVSS